MLLKHYEFCFWQRWDIVQLLSRSSISPPFQRLRKWFVPYKHFCTSLKIVYKSQLLFWIELYIPFLNMEGSFANTHKVQMDIKIMSCNLRLLWKKHMSWQLLWLPEGVPYIQREKKPSFICLKRSREGQCLINATIIDRSLQ